jgi:hypothetical protein
MLALDRIGPDLFLAKGADSAMCRFLRRYARAAVFALDGVGLDLLFAERALASFLLLRHLPPSVSIEAE